MVGNVCSRLGAPGYALFDRFGSWIVPARRVAVAAVEAGPAPVQDAVIVSSL